MKDFVNTRADKVSQCGMSWMKVSEAIPYCTILCRFVCCSCRFHLLFVENSVLCTFEQLPSLPITILIPMQINWSWLLTKISTKHCFRFQTHSLKSCISSQLIEGPLKSNPENYSGKPLYFLDRNHLFDFKLSVILVSWKNCKVLWCVKFEIVRFLRFFSDIIFGCVNHIKWKNSQNNSEILLKFHIWFILNE